VCGEKSYKQSWLQSKGVTEDEDEMKAESKSGGGARGRRRDAARV